MSERATNGRAKERKDGDCVLLSFLVIFCEERHRAPHVLQFVQHSNRIPRLVQLSTAPSPLRSSLFSLHLLSNLVPPFSTTQQIQASPPTHCETTQARGVKRSAFGCSRESFVFPIVVLLFPLLNRNQVAQFSRLLKSMSLKYQSLFLEIGIGTQCY